MPDPRKFEEAERDKADEVTETNETNEALDDAFDDKGDPEVPPAADKDPVIPTSPD
ncbi:MAG TPA: hypothetical protein VFE52_07275 [Devosia sp.]|jgi:hypothetical protein|nr:hypothetical protein [Devosia sp.]